MEMPAAMVLALTTANREYASALPDAPVVPYVEGPGAPGKPFPAAFTARRGRWNPARHADPDGGAR